MIQGGAANAPESEMINRRKLLQTLPAPGLLAAAGGAILERLIA